MQRQNVVLFAVALVKFMIHMFCVSGYGIFRDELYYWACGNRPAWGYVDHPPITPLLARLGCALFGDSALGLRFLPALAGALLVLLAGLMARRLGGGTWAQALAAIAVLTAPIWLGIQNFINVNAFEPLCWLGCVMVAVCVFQTGRARLWLWFGLLAGLGLMNKHSTLFFGFAFVVGLLVTKERRWLADRWFLLAGLVAAAIFLPNVLWQAQHDWPQYELLVNVTKGKNYVAAPFEFLKSQVLLLNPLSLPVWLAGLIFLFRGDGGKWRALGWTFVVFLATMMAFQAKVYYPIPIYAMLFAAGGVALERVTARWTWIRPSLAAVMVLAGALLAPLAIPILPVETFIRYQAALGIEPPRTETHRQGRLPQTFADMFGWEEMARTVGGVAAGLSPEERDRAVIFAQNYGQAGAMEFYGKRYNLPPVICPHNNYWQWGHRNAGEVLIVIGGNVNEAREYFESVEKAAIIANEYAMPYEDQLPVYVCRKLRVPIDSLWPKLKRYI